MKVQAVRPLRLPAIEWVLIIVSYGALILVTGLVEPLASVPLLWIWLPPVVFAGYFALRAKLSERAAT